MNTARASAARSNAVRPTGAPAHIDRPTPAHRLATASWMCPVLIIALNFALQPVRSDPASRYIATMLFGIVALVLSVGGLASGIAALAGMRRNGRAGILVPAMIGSLVSSFYVATFIISYLLAGRP